MAAKTLFILVYIDEAGFETDPICVHAFAKKGKKVFGYRPGKRRPRVNLIAARRKGQKDLLAPMLMAGSFTDQAVEHWLSIYLVPTLTRTSILIMDNAPIHRKGAIREIVESAGHQILFLPKYSPDLNDIEHDFSAN